jgi:hypothetical protein
MDKITAIVLVTCVLVLLAVGVVLGFRHRASVNFKGPFGIGVTLDGGNDPPTQAAGITGQDLKAGRDLAAVNKGGGGVDVRRAEAKGAITLRVEAPGGADDPNH